MTAESTVPSPGGQPREYGFSPVSVIPSRGAADGFRFPAGRRLSAPRAPWLPLLVADGGAAVLTGLSLAQVQRHPPLLAALLLGVLALNTHGTLYRPGRIPTVLDDLPAVCARVVVTWCTLAGLLAALSPAAALPARTLAVGCALQSAVSCAARAVLHWRRRRALVLRPDATLVIGPAGTAQRVAAAFLRHPRCGLRPVGVVAAQTSGAEGLPVLTTGEEVQRALIQNSVRAVLVVEPRSEHGPLLRALSEAGCVLWHVDADSPSQESSYGVPRGRAHGGANGRPGGSGRLAGFSCRLDQRLQAARVPRQTASRRRRLRGAAARDQPTAAGVRGRAAAERRTGRGLPPGAHRQGRTALHPAEVPYPPPGRRARGRDPLERRG